MAKEIVQAIRQAELNAVEKEKEALLEKDRILSKAQQEAKLLATTMTKQANDLAEQALIMANQKGATMLEDAKKRADKEVVLMKEMAKAKEEKAIKLVLSHVI